MLKCERDFHNNTSFQKKIENRFEAFGEKIHKKRITSKKQL